MSTSLTFLVSSLRIRIFSCIPNLMCKKVPPLQNVTGFPRCSKGHRIRVKVLHRQEMPEDICLLIFSICSHSTHTTIRKIRSVKTRYQGTRKACGSWISGRAVNSVLVYWTNINRAEAVTNHSDTPCNTFSMPTTTEDIRCVVDVCFTAPLHLFRRWHFQIIGAFKCK